ncbi:MAG: murein transglycosylase domain-containing protein, partial [Hydrogenovibrio sp.]|nr:murein transglycosylase domain-containing protein [Hydrogenovibrio sp.]
MSQSKTLFYLILATVILLGASSSFLTLFQHWVIAQSSASETQQPPVAEPLGPPLSSIGIRTIISTPKKTVETSVSTPVSKAVAYTAPSNPQAVEAMPSLPQTQPEVPSPVARKAVLTSVTPQVEPSKKTVNRQQPALVVYPDELVIEFPKSLATLTNIKKAVSRLLLSKRPLQEYDLLSNRKLDLRHRPYFYRKVLDQFRNPIRYPKQAYRYADYLIDHGSEELDDEEGRFIAIHIPLV